MTIPKWAPSTLYNPGDFVVPRSNNIVTQEQPHNNSFEDGLTHWTVTSEHGDGSSETTADSTHVFDGSQAVKYAGASGTGTKNSVNVILINDFEAAVTPGKRINFSCYFWRDFGNPNLSFCQGGARIYWYDASHTFISFSIAVAPPGSTYPESLPGTVGGLVGQVWQKSAGSAVAPPGAAFAKAAILMTGNTQSGTIWGDNYTWDYTFQGIPDGLVFVATQAEAATSGATEPVWPLESGESVTDGGVTWNAEFASRITWTASPILESGDTEPTWPTAIGAHVVDNAGSGHDISWVAVDGRITDVNCPQSKIVAIAQSKIYAADTDTIPFSATTNPLDWTTPNDAGYLPFGLQTYGAEPCAGLGLYRSNLVAFNSLGYQMWQIDPDPANMALLDAQPVGSTFFKSIQPVQNDLVFLTPKGIRSLGISGASGNVQAGQFGKNLDPLVIASISTGFTPRGLFYPGTGQYWLCFDNTVYVQTNNGSGNANSWSMYQFPSSIDYWTVDDGILYLRSGDLVWEVSEDALWDDIQNPAEPSSNSVPFFGEITWPYLDLGTPGVDKDFEGVNIVCTGSGNVSVGYDQSNFDLSTDTITFDGDTLPGIGMIPIPMVAPSFQVSIAFDSGQAWEWEMTNIYLNQTGGT